jgi:hypothetical protein
VIADDAQHLAASPALLSPPDGEGHRRGSAQSTEREIGVTPGQVAQEGFKKGMQTAWQRHWNERGLYVQAPTLLDRTS